jgi:hypothetical protein
MVFLFDTLIRKDILGNWEHLICTSVGNCLLYKLLPRPIIEAEMSGRGTFHFPNRSRNTLAEERSIAGRAPRTRIAGFRAAFIEFVSN